MLELVLAASILGTAGVYAKAPGSGSAENRMFARIYGSIAAAYAGNAMGEPVEGWPWEKTEKMYGFLERFVAADKRTARQIAEGICQAFVNELKKTKTAAAEADSLLAK